MFLGAAATSHGALFPPPGSGVARYVGRDDSWSELLHLRCSSSWLSSWLCFIVHAWRPLFLFAGALGVYSVMKKKKSVVRVCVRLFGSHCSSYIVREFCWAFEFFHLCCDLGCFACDFFLHLFFHYSSTCQTPCCQCKLCPLIVKDDQNAASNILPRSAMPQRGWCLPGVPLEVETPLFSSFVTRCGEGPC